MNKKKLVWFTMQLEVPDDWESDVIRDHIIISVEGSDDQVHVPVCEQHDETEESGCP